MDDKEIDSTIREMIQAHIETRRQTVCHVTAPSVVTNSSGCHHEEGMPMGEQKVIIPRRYVPADEAAEDPPPMEHSRQQSRAGCDEHSMVSSVSGAVTVQVGGDCEVPAGTNFRSSGGGIATNHPLLQPLEECDRFGNPIVPGDVKSSGTNDAVSVDCHFEVAQGRGAVKMPNDTMSDPPCAPVNAPMMPNALDSIMAQLDANLR